MRNSIIMSAILLVLTTACDNSTDDNATTTALTDSVTYDTVANFNTTVLNRLDSMRRKGHIVHLDTWKIGKVKSVEIQVQQYSCKNEGYATIVLRKDCGGQYYYSWEEAYIFQKELPFFYEAVKVIKNNLNRKTDHYEKYAYTATDNIVLFAENSGDGWTIVLCVDVNKSNSNITLAPSELDRLVELLQQADNKLNEIK